MPVPSNLPPKISAITVTELATRLASDNPPYVLDVREQSEWDQSHINNPHVHLLPMSTLEDHLESLPQNRPIAVLCHSGGRSGRIATLLQVLGYPAVNVTGGMLEWVAQIDPSLAQP